MLERSGRCPEGSSQSCGIAKEGLGMNGGHPPAATPALPAAAWGCLPVKQMVLAALNPPAATHAPPEAAWAALHHTAAIDATAEDPSFQIRFRQC